MDTVEARRAELDAACKLFMKQLTGPGDFLTGARRAAIAHEAFRAAECSACPKVREGGRGPGLLKRAEGLGVGSNGISCVVLCVANLQDLLDADWYEDAVERFATELASLGEFQGGRDEKVACLTELVTVVAGIVGARQFYIAGGLPLPSLPPTTQGPPLFKHVSEFCKGGLEQTKYAWGFQVMESKIVASGLEKAGQSPSEWASNTNPMTPNSKITATPLSMSYQHSWMEVMYVPPGDVIKFSAKHLTSGFSTAEHPCKAELVEVAEAIAADHLRVPHSGKRVDEAINALRGSGGEQVVLDAAAVAAFFASITIVVDSTGQSNPTLGKAAPVCTAIVAIKRKAMSMLPIFAAVAAVAVSAYIAKRRRLV